MSGPSAVAIRQSRSFNELHFANGAESLQTLRLLRILQGEIAQLKSNINSIEEERKEWSLRYAKRLCVASNLLLALWIFIAKFMKNFKLRKHETDLVARFILASTSKPNSIGYFIVSAIYSGMKASFLFILSLVFLSKNRKGEFYRFVGFSVSTLYSIYLAFVPKFMPRTNYLNVFFNLTHLLTRYYHSQGIPAFKQLQFL
jgi:hypothetical protein